jgi:hypothetical protein
MQKMFTLRMQFISTAPKEIPVPEEHLATQLNAGWRVVSVTPLTGGGGSSGSIVVGWFAVVLEKE